MTLPTVPCECFHLGERVHDPTNPRCPRFSGAGLKLDDGPDNAGPRPYELGEDDRPANTTDLQPHAFTNYGSPGGLCVVPGCQEGPDNEIHQHVPPNATQIGDVNITRGKWHQGRLEPDFRPGPVTNVMNAEPTPIPGMVETLNTQIAMPSLMINVDFNELWHAAGEEKAYEVIGKLKDLLS